MSNKACSVSDPYLLRMTKARKDAAVLKIQLVSLKASLPDTMIFAFEGNDDIGIFYHWIKAIRPDLRYEPFSCDGKKYVLDLKDVVLRDKNDLGHNVYFFIDRDFDGLRGHDAHEALYVTEANSAENYLVSEAVLEDLLKHEYRCHASPLVRRSVLDKFNHAYAEFLDATREINFRLYVAGRCGLGFDDRFPNNIGKVVNIEIDGVTRTDLAPEKIIGIVGEPDQEIWEGYSEEFERLEGRMQYRGKFAHMFFIRWLQKLAEDRATACAHFQGIEEPYKATQHVISLQLLASKSMPPAELGQFLEQIPLAA